MLFQIIQQGEVVDLMVHPQTSIGSLIYIQPSNDIENPSMILQVTMFHLVLWVGETCTNPHKTIKDLNTFHPSYQE